MARKATLMKAIDEFEKRFKSKTEAEFELRLRVGKQQRSIISYEYETQRFKIGEARTSCGKVEYAWYSPDFCVVYPDGTVEQVEIKGGHIREAALVRFKTASMLYPRYRWAMWQKVKGEWIRKF